MRKITKILVFALTLLTMSGCGFLKAISVQNDYASSFDVTTEPPLALGMDYEVKMSRGINDTVFYAYVPKGVQYPVASSAGRVFFQSPEGFELRVNNELRSKIGGIVQISPNDVNDFYIWYFSSDEYNDFTEYFEVEPNGEWIKGVKPNISNAFTRPWVENEMILKR